MMLCRKHYDIETINLDTNYKPCIINKAHATLKAKTSFVSTNF